MRRVTLIMVLLLLPLLSLPLLGQSGEESTQQAEQQTQQAVQQQTSLRQTLEREIELLDRQLSEVKSKHSSSMRQLTLVKRKVESHRALLSELNREIRKLEREIREREAEVKRVTRELEKLTENYKSLIYSAYKNRDQTTWVLYILASKNIEQGFRRDAYLKSFSNSLRESAVKIREKRELLIEEQSRVDSVYRENLKTKVVREREVATLALEEKKSQELVNSLNRREREFRGEIANKRKEVERLNREIERILAAATKEQKGFSQAELEASLKLSSIFEENKGMLPWPVKEGVIIERFGQHNHPLFKNIKMPFNNGINISAPLHSEVMVVFDGVVKQILVMPGYNQCLLVQHGNYYTFYTKLDEVTVATGSSVKRGQVIGKLAENEGGSTLHFQLWHGTNKEDPQKWIYNR